MGSGSRKDRDVMLAATEALGIAPDAAGLADHERVADDWERSGGRTSIVGALLDQLAGGG